MYVLPNMNNTFQLVSLCSLLNQLKTVSCRFVHSAGDVNFVLVYTIHPQITINAFYDAHVMIPTAKGLRFHGILCACRNPATNPVSPFDN